MPRPTVLITGCTKGSIGYELAKQFAAHNYQVYAASRNIDSMGDLNAIPNITLLSIDVSSLDSLTAAHDLISKQTGGKLDILYHNAGYRSLAMGVETPSQEAYRMFNVNVLAIVEMNRVFVDLVVASKGKIVFSGSVSGFTPHPSQSVYCASKAAIDLYARTIRMELKPFGVRVVFVQTAATRTKMSVERISLENDSFYKSLEPRLNQAWTEMEGETMPAEVYAKTVVNKVVKRNPPQQIWCGSGASTVRLIEALGARFAYNIAFTKMMGLNDWVPSRRITTTKVQ